MRAHSHSLAAGVEDVDLSQARGELVRALGLVTYGTYDLTNRATVRGWPWIVTAVDLA